MTGRGQTHYNTSMPMNKGSDRKNEWKKDDMDGNGNVYVHYHSDTDDLLFDVYLPEKDAEDEY